MFNHIGRNDYCWCGSGLKYKKCHLDRDQQEPLKKSDIQNALKKAFSRQVCLVPEQYKTQCSQMISKAHTIPKSGSLRLIARQGHVYSFTPQGFNSPENIYAKIPELRGLSDASTFTGFCSNHDGPIFSAIENQPFVSTDEQCFLLYYRALCRELYLKQAQYELLPLMGESDKGKPLIDQIHMQDWVNQYRMGAELGLRDNTYYKSQCDKIFLNKSFHKIKSFIVNSEIAPVIMCSALVNPEEDFLGNQIQRLGNLEAIPAALSVSSFYGGNNGVIAFSWLEEHEEVARRFVESWRTLGPNKRTDALIRFLFEYIENLHIQPDWWDNLSDANKSYLKTKMMKTVNPKYEHKRDCLQDDGVHIDDWPLVITT